MDYVNKIFKSLSPRRIARLTIYAVLATVVGHYLEAIWQLFRFHLDGPSALLSELTVTPIAEPYGFGVVGLILLVVPFVEKYKPSIVTTYILNVLVTGLVEYICAFALVFAYGRNDYWDYSDYPFNIQGYVCLEFSMVFGVMATLFVYLVYPVSERWLGFMNRRQLIATTLILIMFYTVSRIVLSMK